MVEHGFGFIPTLGENLGRADSAGGCVLEQLEDSKDTSGFFNLKGPWVKFPLACRNSLYEVFSVDLGWGLGGNTRNTEPWISFYPYPRFSIDLPDSVLKHYS